MTSLYAGVEESKEDCQPRIVNNQTVGTKGSANIEPTVQETYDRSAQCDTSLFENLTRNLFGSCGSVVEAASFFVSSSLQRNEPEEEKQSPTPPNVGQVNELAGARPPKRRIDPLARFAGRYQSKSLNPKSKGLHAVQPQVQQFNPQKAEIPAFLQGENVSYSFDDNISALSAHTLEDMARRGMMGDNTAASSAGFGELETIPQTSKSSDAEDDCSYQQPPSPTRTCSSSSQSQESLKADSLQSGSGPRGWKLEQNEVALTGVEL